MADSKLTEFIKRLSLQLYSEWDRLEMEAGQEGQLYQDSDAEEGYMLYELRKLMEPELRVFVCDCAGVLDGRAEMFQEQNRSIALQSEIRKAADLVRHNALAVTGESYVCYRCDGRGCEKCGHGGIVRQEWPNN